MLERHLNMRKVYFLLAFLFVMGLTQVNAQCSAGFQYSSNNSLTVQFNDSSSTPTGYIIYSWNFGDGSSSSAQNPIHSYVQNGTYKVCLSILDSLGNCSDSICQDIIVPSFNDQTGCCDNRADSLILNPCRASYSYTISYDTLFIQNTSRFSDVNYNFGDGASSSLENPFHIYGKSGTYNVCQIINTDGCSGSYCDSISITVPPKCNAGFAYSFSGDTTYFQSTATSGNNFIYRFGDGASSTDENPFHTYQSSGTYIVEQEIFNDSTFCADLFIDTIQVTVSFSCKAEFIPALDTSQTDVLFIINSSSSDNTHEYLWDFGDGNVSTSRIPTHQFTENKAYKICLTVSDSIQECTSTFCDSIGLDEAGGLLKSGGFTLKVIEGTALSINENKTKHSLINVFPNPFSASFTLENLTADELLSYQLYSSHGQLILDGKIQAKQQYFSLDHLPSGLYMLHIQQGSKFSNLQLIKQ